MLGDGKYRKVVASTIPEILGCLPLAKAGQLDEVSQANQNSEPRRIKLTW